MIRVDVSRVVPKRLGTYLLGLIPGALFELTAAYGDPQMASHAIERVRGVYPFPSYGLVILFAASCLVVGQTFFLAAWFLDWSIDLLYRAQRYLIFHATLGSDWLYRFLGRLQGIPPKRYFRHIWPPIMWARGKKIPFEVRPVLKCQRMAATQILKRKFGVTPSKGQWEWVDQEWQAWLAVLGMTPSGVKEMFLTMRTFLACGLAELAVLYTSPALRNRYFTAMVGVLLAAGCFQSISFARRRGEPVRANIIRLLTLMEELSTTRKEKKGAESPVNGASTITLDVGDEGGEMEE